VRRYWVGRVEAEGLPCSLCGRYLVTDTSQYKIMINGRVIINPHYLVVGHITPRSVAYSLGRTVDQIMTIEATRPECWHCSKRGGAKIGNAMQRQAITSRAASPRATDTTTPVEGQTLVSRW